MKKFLLLFILCFSFLIPQSITANEADIIFYYSQNCPHCEKQAAWLRELEADYTIAYRDIQHYEKEFNQALETYDIAIPMTPLMIFQGKAYSGYMDKADFLSGKTAQNGCAIDVPCQTPWYEKTPLIFVAMVFGLLDGFNPCAMWVLIIMITFLLRVQEQKRLKILGFTFIFTTALIYYLILNSWLKVSPLLARLPFFTKGIAVIILLFAGHSLIKLYRQKGCEISQSRLRKTTIRSLSKISQHQSLVLAIGMVIILATLVNLIELACSLGFPITFIEILKVNQVNQVFYQAYLLIYVAFFIFDDVLVLLFALKNKKLKALGQKHKKKIQIVSSLMLIVLALILLYDPSLLSF